MDRNIQKNGLINFLLLIGASIGCVLVAQLAGSHTGEMTVIFLGLSVLTAGVSYFQMRLENSERLEKLEFDELKKAKSSAAMFESREGEVFPAERARMQFEKWLVPVFSVVLTALQLGAAYWMWDRFAKAQTPANRMPEVAMSMYGLFAIVQFLLGKYSAGIARLEGQRLLRPGANSLLLGAYLCFLSTAAIAAGLLGFPKVDYYAALVLCVLLTLVALETLVGLVLEIYRPRVRGRVVRILYESRLIGLLSQPESLFTTAAQALDYQFGFKVSETWFYQFLERAFGWIFLVQLGALWLSTTMVILEPSEQALLERFGNSVPGREVLPPGLHFKFPWPIDTVHRFSTESIQSIQIGFIPDPAKEKEKTVLWTVAHYKEEFNMLVASREQLDGGTNNAPDRLQSVPVNLLTVSIPVQYQIKDVRAWAYNFNDAPAMLEKIATREVVRYLVGVDINEVMSSGRAGAAETLRQRIQKAADEPTHNLGVNIIYVGVQDIHPPVAVAPSYEAVVGAMQEREAKILVAEGDRDKTNTLTRAEAIQKVREAEADKVRRITAAKARSAQFGDQLTAFAKSPTVYPQRVYLHTFARASAGTRKFFVGPTNTHEVFQINLEEKVRQDLTDVIIPPAKPK